MPPFFIVRGWMLSSQPSYTYNILEIFKLPSSGSCAHLHSHKQYLGLPASPQPCQHSGVSLWELLKSIKRNLRVALICFSLTLNEAEHLFMFMGPVDFSFFLGDWLLHSWIPPRALPNAWLQSCFSVKIGKSNKCLYEWVDKLLNKFSCDWSYKFSIRYDSSLKQHKIWEAHRADVKATCQSVFEDYMQYSERE